MSNKIKIIITVCLSAILVTAFFNSCFKERDPLVISLTLDSYNGYCSAVTTTYQGKIESEGMWSITEKGVCWTTFGLPTIYDSKTNDGSGTAMFNNSVTHLLPGTQYYIRAYATYSQGTVYSTLQEFTTPLHGEISFGNDSIYGAIFDNEGNIYKTINIGSQTWMAENLKVKKFRNGTDIPNVTDNTNWQNQTSAAYCDYYNTPVTSSVYGRLYNWQAVTASENICPAGWHIPTDNEWKTLELYVGLSEDNVNKTGERGNYQGAHLKEGKFSTSGHWYFKEGIDNSFGFTALPGGFRDSTGEFSNLGKTGFWWTVSQSDVANAWYRSISKTKINRRDSNKKFGYSIRCLQD